MVLQREGIHAEECGQAGEVAKWESHEVQKGQMKAAAPGCEQFALSVQAGG